STKLTKQSQRELSNQIRVLLAERHLKVVDRGSQERALKEMVTTEKAKSYASCVDSSCQIPLGKTLAATHILRTTIASFGPTTCTTSGELIDLKTEVTVSAGRAKSTCTPDHLLDAVENLADQLIRDSAQ